MDLSHLQGHYEELLNYMEQKGYSDTYISRFREEIQRILKRADDNAWESYRDIYMLTSYSSYTKPFFAIIKMPEDIEKSSFLLA